MTHAEITLNGVYTFENWDGDNVAVQIDGRYDISTIPAVAGHETILFRTGGTGPSQIELYWWKTVPTARRVRQELREGKFRALGV